MQGTTSPSKPLPDEEPEDTDLSEFFPLNKPLVEIKRLINELNFKKLYESSSSYFKKHTNVAYLESTFSKLKVRKLTSTYRNANKELLTAIISFELQKGNGCKLGHRIMHFNYEDNK